MSLRDGFHKQDWRTLQFSFLWTFEAVAGVDGNIDDKEQQMMQQALVEAHDHPLAIFREVIMSLEASFHALRLEYQADSRSIDAGLQHTMEILRHRVSSADVAAFREALLSFGQRVAQASGGFWGMGNKVSRAERQTLERLAILLDS